MSWTSVDEKVLGPKLRKFAKEINTSQAEALGILIILWMWGMNNANEEGLIINADKSDIEMIFIPYIKPPITTELIIEKLIESGWLDEENGEMYLHDWGEHQAAWYQYKNRKEYDAKRKREARAAEKAISESQPDDVGTLAPEEEPKKKATKKKEPAEDKISFSEFVSMTQAEFDKLVLEIGKPATDIAIEILNNYKGSTGKKYKSDYLAIKNWVIDKVKEKHRNIIQSTNKPVSNEKGNPFDGKGW